MKKRILLVADIEGWAYDDAAKHWQSMLKDEYDIDIMYLAEHDTLRISHSYERLFREYQTYEINNKSLVPDGFIDTKNMFHDPKTGKKTKPLFDHNDYDGIYFFYHRGMCDRRLLNTPFPLSKVAIALNNEKWMEDGPGESYHKYFKGAKVLVGCNSFIINQFKKINIDMMRVSQTIDPKVFNMKRKEVVSKRSGSSFTVGWTGNYSNKIKNYKLAKSAAVHAGARFVKARDLSREQLNNFYNKVDVLLCASKSEGGPLMLLEAGACSIPIITTKVGLAREIISNGKNGRFVKEDVNDMANAIKFYRANRNIRKRHAEALSKEVLENWTYEARLDEVRAVFERLCS